MAAGKYVVVWPKVRVSVKGKRKTLAKDDMVPDGVETADLQNLVSFGAIAGVREVGSTAATDADSTTTTSTPNPDSIEAILAAVGDDQGKAIEALKLEQAKGEAARSSLVKKLEKIAAGSGS